MHEASRCEVGSGIAGGSGTDHEEDRYGPWMVVTRKRGGQKGTTKGVQQLDPTQSALRSKTRDSLVRNNPSNGNQVWNEAKVMGFTPETDLEKAGKGGLVLGPNLKLGGLMDKPGVQDKAHISPSVKGKKVMARNKVLTQLNEKASDNNMSHFTSATQPFSFLDNNGIDANFHFSSTPSTELGKRSGERPWRS